MNVLDLFSGIGGFSLGLERAGFKTVAFCEIDPYCRRVLRKHWPNVPIYDDVRTLTAARLVADAKGVDVAWRRCSGANQQDAKCDTPNAENGGIDVICGGFPCQDISTAGKGAGITGERSGLWKEYARLIGEVRPRYAIIENVSALLSRGLGDVLYDLSAIGYDAEWHCIPASAVGAPHRRDRVWIVANAQQPGERWRRVSGHGEDCETVGEWPPGQSIGAGEDVADAEGAERPGQWRSSWGRRAELGCGDWWRTEPDVGRVAHGVSARVDRLRSLGNAVVPQIPEIIGKAIMQQQGVKT